MTEAKPIVDAIQQYVDQRLQETERTLRSAFTQSISDNNDTLETRIRRIVLEELESRREADENTLRCIVAEAVKANNELLAAELTRAAERASPAR